MEPLVVTGTEFYARDNAKENYTNEYDIVHSTESPAPVFRRGQNFHFGIRFNRPFDEKNDVVRIHFYIGPKGKASVMKGTRIILTVAVNQTEMPPENNWRLRFVRNAGDTILLQAHIPCSAPVGIWKCSVRTGIAGQTGKKLQEHEADDDIYILFNPWCKDDPVYMENEVERNEYVLNENGKIWIGTFREPKGKRWVFGQFDDVVLPSAVFLLEKSNLPYSDRGSPVLMARAISAVINSKDDDGLLEGRWDGEYSDGTSPFAWTGSVAIMDEFLKTGGKSVKYGQCWVYSAITVSVCRALGLPCRSVTNYVSAHDTNSSLTVDKYFDMFGNHIEGGPEGDCNDSCWNFHVWNDVWMERPDLPEGYSGWQIIDGTPQELSDCTFRCGPASVVAVRNGEVGFLYDTPFVFSEVNADICHFQEDNESDWGFSRLSINRYQVGQRILTKSPHINDCDGDKDMWDVTLFYKNSEGSEAERRAVFNAIKGVPKAQQHYQIPSKAEEDVFFDLVDIDTVPIGQGFDVVVNIKNNSNEIRSITATLSASSVFYTGATANRLKAAKGSFSLKGGNTEVLRIHVSSNDYLDKLVDHSLVKIYAIANVKETKQTWCEEDDFTFEKPELLSNPVNGCVGQECAVQFRFMNPLDVSLTDCRFSIEGAGLQKPKIFDFRNVGPKENVDFTKTFVPKRPGKHTIVATFNSKQMQGINGSTTVTIE